MTYIKTYDTALFKGCINNISFKPNDHIEARVLGYMNALQASLFGYHSYNEYYLIYHNNKLVAFVRLLPDNTFINFTSTYLTDDLKFKYIRILKQILKSVLKRINAVFTYVYNGHKEGTKVMRICGGKIYKKINNNIDLYVLSNIRG